jgi:hypothetical protein
VLLLVLVTPDFPPVEFSLKHFPPEELDFSLTDFLSTVIYKDLIFPFKWNKYGTVHESGSSGNWNSGNWNT